MPGVMKTVDMSTVDHRWVSGVPVSASDWYAGQADRHATVPVSVGLTTAWIDARVAPLVHYMWKAGITTTDSCEDLFGRPMNGHDAWVWVGLASPMDMERFLDFVTPQDDPEFLEHMCRDFDDDGWLWSVSPPRHGSRAEIHCAFPKDDLRYLLMMLTSNLGVGESEVDLVMDWLDAFD